MCLICDGYSQEQVDRSVELNIQVHGFHIQGVRCGPDDGPNAGIEWSVSVGLTESHGIPEFIVVQHSLDFGGRVMWAARNMLLSGGTLDDLRDRGIESVLVAPDQLETELFNAYGRHYRHDPAPGSYVQLIPEVSVDVPDLSDPAVVFPPSRNAEI